VIPISDYTVVNRKEVEDSFGDNAALDAHFGRKHLDSEHLGVSHFRAGPGFRSEKGHSHREQEEVYIVVAGSGRIKLGQEIVELRPWDAGRVAPATVRSLEAGPDGLEFIAVGSDRPEGGGWSVREQRPRTDRRGPTSGLGEDSGKVPVPLGLSASGG
jgi:mannose-6-phosphate isomerase-like protein (cupin superfamily)